MVSLLLVLLAIPLWLDPQTLTEVVGRATVTAPPATGLHLLTPRPDAPTPGPSLAATVVAADHFGRNLADSWGSAEVGGAYTLSGTGAPSVENSAAVVRLAPGDAGSAVLGSLGVREAALEFTVSVDQLPLDGELMAYALLRVSDSGAAYRLAMHMTSAGDTYVAIERLVGGHVERIGGQVLVSTLAAGVSPGPMHVRAEALGDDPTTLRLRTWPDGVPEPAAWQLSTIDWTGTLQEPGTIGIGWRLDAAQSQRLVMAFSALEAWDLGGGK